jgi:hypothetical protein
VVNAQPETTANKLMVDPLKAAGLSHEDTMEKVLDLIVEAIDNSEKYMNDTIDILAMVDQMVDEVKNNEAVYTAYCNYMRLMDVPSKDWETDSTLIFQFIWKVILGEKLGEDSASAQICNLVKDMSSAMTNAQIDRDKKDQEISKLRTEIVNLQEEIESGCGKECINSTKHLIDVDKKPDANSNYSTEIPSGMLDKMSESERNMIVDSVKQISRLVEAAHDDHDPTNEDKFILAHAKALIDNIKNNRNFADLKDELLKFCNVQDENQIARPVLDAYYLDVFPFYAEQLLETHCDLSKVVGDMTNRVSSEYSKDYILELAHDINIIKLKVASDSTLNSELLEYAEATKCRGLELPGDVTDPERLKILLLPDYADYQANRANELQNNLFVSELDQPWTASTFCRHTRPEYADATINMLNKLLMPEFVGKPNETVKLLIERLNKYGGVEINPDDVDGIEIIKYLPEFIKYLVEFYKKSPDCNACANVLVQNLHEFSEKFRENMDDFDYVKANIKMYDNDKLGDDAIEMIPYIPNVIHRLMESQKEAEEKAKFYSDIVTSFKDKLATYDSLYSGFDKYVSSTHGDNFAAELKESMCKSMEVPESMVKFDKDTQSNVVRYLSEFPDYVQTLVKRKDYLQEKLNQEGHCGAMLMDFNRKMEDDFPGLNENVRTLARIVSDFNEKGSQPSFLVPYLPEVLNVLMDEYYVDHPDLYRTEDEEELARVEAKIAKENKMISDHPHCGASLMVGNDIFGTAREVYEEDVRKVCDQLRLHIFKLTVENKRLWKLYCGQSDDVQMEMNFESEANPFSKFYFETDGNQTSLVLSNDDDSVKQKFDTTSLIDAYAASKDTEPMVPACALDEIVKENNDLKARLVVFDTEEQNFSDSELVKKSFIKYINSLGQPVECTNENVNKYLDLLPLYLKHLLKTNKGLDSRILTLTSENEDLKEKCKVFDETVSILNRQEDIIDDFIQYINTYDEEGAVTKENIEWFIHYLPLYARYMYNERNAALVQAKGATSDCKNCNTKAPEVYSRACEIVDDINHDDELYKTLNGYFDDEEKKLGVGDDRDSRLLKYLLPYLRDVLDKQAPLEAALNHLDNLVKTSMNATTKATIYGSYDHPMVDGRTALMETTDTTRPQVVTKEEIDRKRHPRVTPTCDAIPATEPVKPKKTPKKKSSKKED